MWTISVKLSDAEMGIQDTVNALPKEGGTVNISEGVYIINGPLEFPSNPKSHVKIVGCSFEGGKKAKTVKPGKVEFVGNPTTTVYWNGSTWKAFPKDAKKFKTQDEAENYALYLVMKKPHLIGLVSVEPLT